MLSMWAALPPMRSLLSSCMYLRWLHRSTFPTFIESRGYFRPPPNVKGPNLHHFGNVWTRYVWRRPELPPWSDGREYRWEMQAMQIHKRPIAGIPSAGVLHTWTAWALSPQSVDLRPARGTSLCRLVGSATQTNRTPIPTESLQKEVTGPPRPDRRV